MPESCSNSCKALPKGKPVLIKSLTCTGRTLIRLHSPRYSQDAAKYAETLEKLLDVRRKHGTGDEVRSTARAFDIRLAGEQNADNGVAAGYRHPLSAPTVCGGLSAAPKASPVRCDGADRDDLSYRATSRRGTSHHLPRAHQPHQRTRDSTCRRRDQEASPAAGRSGVDGGSDRQAGPGGILAPEPVAQSVAPGARRSRRRKRRRSAKGYRAPAVGSFADDPRRSAVIFRSSRGRSLRRKVRLEEIGARSHGGTSTEGPLSRGDGAPRPRHVCHRRA